MSATLTRFPCLCRYLARWLPIKPPPPVISILSISADLLFVLANGSVESIFNFYLNVQSINWMALGAIKILIRHDADQDITLSSRRLALQSSAGEYPNLIELTQSALSLGSFRLQLGKEGI